MRFGLIWVLGSLGSLVWAICITNNNNCALCNVQPLKMSIAPLTNYIAPYLLSKQQRNYTTKKEMQIFLYMFSGALCHLISMLQITFNSQSLLFICDILKWVQSLCKLFICATCHIHPMLCSMVIFWVGMFISFSATIHWCIRRVVH